MGFLTFPLCFADLSQLRRAISYSLNLSCSWDFYGFCYLKLPQGKQNYFWRTTVLQKVSLFLSFRFPQEQSVALDRHWKLFWLDLWSITNLSKRQRIHTFFYEATKRCEASKGLACILESLSLPQKETYKSLFLRPSGTPRSRSYIISLLKMLLPPVSLDA